MKTILCICALLAVLALGAMAEDTGKTTTNDNSEGVMYPIEKLGWMAGHWVGEGFGGIGEEVWAPLSAGSMVGSFKLSVDNGVKFYEIMTITQDTLGPRLTLKHFNADLTGWEEKDETVVFPFVSAEHNKIVFDGLRYELIDDSTMWITVSIHGKDGSMSEEVFKCKKQ